MKRVRIPENFEVTARICDLAKKNSWPNPHEEVEAFKDYHLAHGTLMLDWEAAFRTWLRNAVRFRAEKKPVYTKDPKPIHRREDRPEEPRLDSRVGDLLHGLVEKLAGNK